jgi:CDGSH-type Zn-finger protein
MESPKIAARFPAAVTLEPGTYFWCACGRSSNQPFCDGSHKGTGLSPVSFTIDTKKSVFLCQCKQTKNKPFCDGSHKSL